MTKMTTTQNTATLAGKYTAYDDAVTRLDAVINNTAPEIDRVLEKLGDSIEGRELKYVFTMLEREISYMFDEKVNAVSGHVYENNKKI